MLRKLPYVATFALASNAVMAADEPKLTQWKGEAELGLVSTSGNTETDTINAKAKISKELEKWRHTAEFTALNTSDKTGTTAERYELKGQSDYKFSEHEYIFALVNYEDDRFSGYDYRVSESVGYGRRVLDRPDMTLDLEAGPGVRQSKLDDGSRNSEFLVRGAVKYAWSITKTSNFTENVSVEAGDDATITKSVTALTSKVNGDLAMRVSYTVKHTSEVPPGFEKTDTETAVTLVYSY
jgi:putative salt-induced outer membrane protein